MAAGGNDRTNSPSGAQGYRSELFLMRQGPSTRNPKWSCLMQHKGIKYPKPYLCFLDPCRALLRICSEASLLNESEGSRRSRRNMRCSPTAPWTLKKATWVFGSGIWGSHGFSVQGLGLSWFSFRVSMFSVRGLGFSLGFRVQGFGFRV